MKINKNLTTRNYTKGNNRSIKYIVIHYVGAVSSAKANCSYFKSAYRGASAHYFVDDTSIWQCVDDKNIAWHCGGGLQGSKGHTYFKKCLNSNSIGVEMCCYKNNGKLDVSPKTETNTIELVKELLKKYPKATVIRHFDVTGKNCPAPFVSDENRWKSFKSRLTINSVTITKKSYTGTYPSLGLKGYLKKGDKGTQVKRLQQFLNWCIGSKLTVDGSFGDKTVKAVKEYQKKYGLTVDGYFGKASLNKAKTIKK